MTMYARSNYFPVKNEDEFKEWCDEYELSVLTHPSLPGLFAFVCDDDRGDGLTYGGLSDDGETQIDVDLIDELQPHLTEDAVAVLIEVDDDENYMGGIAYIIDGKGNQKKLSLVELAMAEAQKINPNVTYPQYDQPQLKKENS